MTTKSKMTDLAITDNRRDMLTAVRDGRVEYATAAGYWMLDEQRQTGWCSRTLSELNRAGLIQRTPVKTSARKPKTASKTPGREAATLTRAGRAALTG